MKKIIFALCLLLLNSHLMGENNRDDLETDSTLPVISTELLEEINRKGTTVTAEIREKKMDGILILSESRNFRALSAHPNIEFLTGIKKEWLSEVADQLEILGNYKIQMETSSLRGHGDKYYKAYTNYQNALNTYLEILKQPKTVSDRKTVRP